MKEFIIKLIVGIGICSFFFLIGNAFKDYYFYFGWIGGVVCLSVLQEMHKKYV